MSTKQILFCEQNDELRLLAAEALRSHGFIVVPSPDFLETLALIRKGLRPDCTLLDLNSPIEASMKALKLRREALSGEESPLIVSSGRLDLVALAEACHLEWILPKPYELDTLIATVREACQKGRGFSHEEA